MTASDRKTRKNIAMTEVHAVEEILRRWDPIGVKPGVDGPLDEYDSYAPHIVSMVKSAATAPDLTIHLEHIATVTIGIGPSTAATQARSHKCAAEIIEVLRPWSDGHK